jgi:hypothetical protein
VTTGSRLVKLKEKPPCCSATRLSLPLPPARRSPRTGQDHSYVQPFLDQLINRLQHHEVYPSLQPGKTAAMDTLTPIHIHNKKKALASGGPFSSRAEFNGRQRRISVNDPRPEPVDASPSCPALSAPLAQNFKGPAHNSASIATHSSRRSRVLSLL